MRLSRTSLKGLELDIAGSLTIKGFQTRKYKEWKEAGLLRTEEQKVATSVRTRQEIAMQSVLEREGIRILDGDNILQIFNEHAARRRAEKS